MHIRLLILGFLVTSFCANNALAQPITSTELIGRWQIRTNAIAAGWNDNYQFYQNGTFVFNFNEMVDNGKRIVSVLGNFRLSGDTLFFTPRFTEELVGGDIKRGGPPNGGEWELQGPKIKRLPVKRPLEESTILSHCEPKARGAICICIDRTIFYKISNDPEGEYLDLPKE